MTKSTRTHIERYTILSFEMATGYEAVFEDANSTGGFDRIPVDAIGLAKWEEFSLDPGQKINQVDKSDPAVYSTDNVIVALCLMPDGSWEISNECCNYVGMFKVGQELPKAK